MQTQTLPTTTPHPFTVEAGRLHLEQVDLAGLLAELLAGQETGAAWLVGDRALRDVLGACSGPRTVAIRDVGPREVLGRMAAAGFWARAASSHELALAAAAGFPAERTTAAGSVRDDGFVKDALTARLAVMEHDDEHERDNAARIARLLGLALPAETGAPRDLPPNALAACGGLLARVLRPPPGLALDAPLPARRGADGAATVLALTIAPPAGAARPGTLAGLGGAAAPAEIHGHPARGDGAVVLRPDAAAPHPDDPAHPVPPTVMVSDARWRILEERGRPD